MPGHNVISFRAMFSLLGFPLPSDSVSREQIFGICTAPGWDIITGELPDTGSSLTGKVGKSLNKMKREELF